MSNTSTPRTSVTFAGLLNAATEAADKARDIANNYGGTDTELNKFVTLANLYGNLAKIKADAKGWG